MLTLTIKNVPPELLSAIEKERLRRGTGVDRCVVELLGHALCIGSDCDEALEKQAARWTEDELEDFERSLASLEALHGRSEVLGGGRQRMG